MSATGYASPPLIIFDRKRLKPELMMVKYLELAMVYQIKVGLISKFLRIGLNVTFLLMYHQFDL